MINLTKKKIKEIKEKKRNIKRSKRSKVSKKSKKKLTFKQLKKDLKDKKEFKKSLFFLLYFLLFFISIYSLLNYTILYKYINYFFGITTSFILDHIFLIPTNFYFDTINNISVISILNTDIVLVITTLCTSILEFTLIASALLASKGVAWSYRFKGLLLVLPIVVIFNLVRIISTTLIIYFLDLSIAEFFHSFLFRIFLIIIVVGYYYLWFKRYYK